MDLKEILTITGKPGLYRLVGPMKNGAIVESLIDGKKFPAYARNPISSLDDISIYGYEEERSLREIFPALFIILEGKPFPNEQMNTQEMIDVFEAAFPDFDEDRVKKSHIKKVMQWYNLLVEKEIITKESIAKPANEEPNENESGSETSVEE